MKKDWFMLRVARITTTVLVAKVVKFGPLPVRLALAGQYMVHHPDTFDQKLNIQFSVIPSIRKLIKGNLLGE